MFVSCEICVKRLASLFAIGPQQSAADPHRNLAIELATTCSAERRRVCSCRLARPLERVRTPIPSGSFVGVAPPGRVALARRACRSLARTAALEEHRAEDEPARAEGEGACWETERHWPWNGLVWRLERDVSPRQLIFPPCGVCSSDLSRPVCHAAPSPVQARLPHRQPVRSRRRDHQAEVGGQSQRDFSPSSIRRASARTTKARRQAAPAMRVLPGKH